MFCNGVVMWRTVGSCDAMEQLGSVPYGAVMAVERQDSVGQVSLVMV